MNLLYSGERAGFTTTGKSIWVGGMGSVPARCATSVRGVSSPLRAHSSANLILSETRSTTSTGGTDSTTLSGSCGAISAKTGISGSAFETTKTVLGALLRAMSPSAARICSRARRSTGYCSKIAECAMAPMGDGATQ